LDVDKLKQWMALAQKMQGSENFWDTIFNDEYANEFIKKQAQSFHQSTNQQQQEHHRHQEDPHHHKEFPLLDLYIIDNKLIILFQLPGARKEDIHLSYSGNIIVIRGKIHPPFDHHVPKHSELYYGSFERKVQLPITCDQHNILAKFEDGILSVSLVITKSDEEKIPIN
jgi:HSP20 family protein